MLKKRIQFQINNSEYIVAVLKYYLAHRPEFKKNSKGFVPDKSSLHIEEVLLYGIKTGEFKVENLEDYKELPISMGLHPYFKVPSSEKKNIKFNFEGGKSIEEQFDKWSNGQFVSIDNPKLKDPSAVMEIVFPNMHTLVIDPSVEYQKIWVWSMPDKDFICIEPVMRDVGGLVNDPQKIRPKETFSASVNFNIKEV